MKIAVTGSTGFIGTALCAAIAQRGWEPVRVGRTPQAADLEAADAVIHLAGETVSGRWTAEKKAEIERSRIEGTRALVDAIARTAHKPAVLVSASGAGYYGDRGDEPLTEESSAGDDFLARVCVGWECETARARQFGVRTVSLRTGIVLGEGGALEQMMMPFAFGAGGPIGSGRQFVPWIHLDDVVAMYLWAVENEAVSGAVNAVTPDYATSARFGNALGAAMRRPAIAPAPAFALRLIVGEFAETILGGQLALASVAERAGFTWAHPRLETALQAIVAPNRPSRILREFQAGQTVDGTMDEVFSFFSDAHNLEAITPSNVGFTITRAPAQLREGATIEYRLRVRGIPVKWKTLITRWDPPHGFADVQLHGPYALWEHVHAFAPAADGVEMTDRVTYALPLYPLGGLAGGIVERDVNEIFAYRRRVIAQKFTTRPSEVRTS